MRGFITELDFEKCEREFPGIVRYYRELKDKPTTFLELLWGFTQRECGCAEPVRVTAKLAIPFVVR